MANIYQTANDMSQINNINKQIINYNNNNFLNYYIRAEQYIAENEYEEARKLYFKIINEYNAEDATSWYGLFKLDCYNFRYKKYIWELVRSYKSGSEIKLELEYPQNKNYKYACRYGTLDFMNMIDNVLSLFREKALNFYKKVYERLESGDTNQLLGCWKDTQFGNCIYYVFKYEDYLFFYRRGIVNLTKYSGGRIWLYDYKGYLDLRIEKTLFRKKWTFGNFSGNPIYNYLGSELSLFQNFGFIYDIDDKYIEFEKKWIRLNSDNQDYIDLNNNNAFKNLLKSKCTDKDAF